jgi:rRNA-processing protein FCF1
LKRVIIDTSSILFGFTYNRNVFERAKEQFSGYKLTVSRGIIKELTKFSNTNGAKGIRARVALLELKAKKINVDNISVYPDKYILDSASRDRNCIVITNDTILAKKLSLINVKVYKISKSGILKLF